jgi:hypothetical protein
MRATKEVNTSTSTPDGDADLVIINANGCWVVLVTG